MADCGDAKPVEVRIARIVGDGMAGRKDTHFGAFPSAGTGSKWLACRLIVLAVGGIIESGDGSLLHFHLHTNSNNTQ